MAKTHILSFMIPTLFARIFRDSVYLSKYAQKGVGAYNTRHFAFILHWQKC